MVKNTLDTLYLGAFPLHVGDKLLEEGGGVHLGSDSLHLALDVRGFMNVLFPRFSGQQVLNVLLLHD